MEGQQAAAVDDQALMSTPVDLENRYYLFISEDFMFPKRKKGEQPKQCSV